MTDTTLAEKKDNLLAHGVIATLIFIVILASCFCCKLF